ncbi:pyridoxal phosphate-dependent aminotransferase [Sporosarcina thermotolerans]|uniref:Pyridoxal phosphate-dependent aminotransferase n=1 Tax=Sporosarcina thermotolerans TaxID=633404 RepID=A0AAW9AD94_9BACL|nr:pyridoxal phosphate-dependent aminotransferase [Sporosarcina thermotolerans]MDW0117093.1 pyridoxal phosphate-dependent aminotransferase [Sporosarcina thermotolerans]
MISNRLNNMPPHFFSGLVKKVEAAKQSGLDIINLGRGNPDQPTPDHIIKALQLAAERPENHGYSPFNGIPELRKAVADFYNREYGVEVDPDTEVAILGGSKIGLVEIPLAMMNEGDLLLLPDPGYPDYLSGVSLANIKYETMPLLKENGYMPDFASISDEAKQKAKIMYLNYPNNPTSAVANIPFFEETIFYARDNGIFIVHDMAYGGIGFDGVKPVSFLQADGAKELGIELYTLSKTYNMAGWRVAFAVGNAKMIEAISRLQSQLFIGMFPGIQHAAIAALGADQSCVGELTALYESRRNVLISECQRIGWDVEAPKASFFAWLPVPEGYTSESFADILLQKAGVVVAPGNGFGKHGEGYVRVGLLESEERIAEAVGRIEALGIFTASEA